MDSDIKMIKYDEKIMKKIILQEEKKIEKQSVFWNMLFSILTSLQSALILLIVTRINGTGEAGVLSIAYATSYLMYAIGTYGIRNFQATDSKKIYSYDDYRNMRMVSCGLMIISSLLYCSYKKYDGDKAAIVLMVCFLKLLEAVENLYHGEFQRIGRLDIAGFLGVIRLLSSYIMFIVILFLTKNLLMALGSITILSFIILIFTRSLFGSLFIRAKKGNKERKVIELLKICFPLFLTSFFSIYITNVPKYAIDACLLETEQAYYAIISMPVFTINLLSGILYQPKLVYMAKLWNEDKRKMFKKVLLKQIQSIVMIGILILFLGLTIGIKLLEILYGVFLSDLRIEFAILLIGGGIVAIYNFLIACITIIRKQKFLIWLSIIMMLLSYRISNPMVKNAGLMGASWLYLCLMTSEMVAVFIGLWIYLKK